jgi:hypothetical protein
MFPNFTSTDDTIVGSPNRAASSSIGFDSEPIELGIPAQAAQGGGKLATSLFQDLQALRIDSASTIAGISEVLTHVPVRKPNRAEFFRIHPSESLVTSVFVDREEGGEVYVVAPNMRGPLAGEIGSVLLVPAINRQGGVFVWPVRLPSEDGWRNTWTITAYQAAGLAKEHWIRLVSDRGVSGYRVYRAEGELSDPVWSTMPFQDLLELAFRGRAIETEDHPIVRRLRGLL